MKTLYAVILAAGVSRRLGFSKLFVRIDGDTVIRRAVTPFISHSLSKVLVVVGRDMERFEKELCDLPVEIVSNPNYEQGMSSSVKAALPHLKGSDGVFFHLGDKPFVDRNLVDRMAQIFNEEPHNIILPQHLGRGGHPVLIPRELIGEEMPHLSGDMGLREIIEMHKEDMVSIEGDEGVLLDIDTLDHLDKLRRRGYSVEES